MTNGIRTYSPLYQFILLLPHLDINIKQAICKRQMSLGHFHDFIKFWQDMLLRHDQIFKNLQEILDDKQSNAQENDLTWNPVTLSVAIDNGPVWSPRLVTWSKIKFSWILYSIIIHCYVKYHSLLASCIQIAFFIWEFIQAFQLFPWEETIT